VSLARIFHRLRAHWRADRARRELHALGDRTLRDIGLRRADIDALIAEACVKSVTDRDTETQQRRSVLALHH
jgi:uncharacterized protein YjiS (DUF1127 family)